MSQFSFSTFELFSFYHVYMETETRQFQRFILFYFYYFGKCMNNKIEPEVLIFWNKIPETWLTVAFGL